MNVLHELNILSVAARNAEPPFDAGCGLDPRSPSEQLASLRRQLLTAPTEPVPLSEAPRPIRRNWYRGQVCRVVIHGRTLDLPARVLSVALALEAAHELPVLGSVLALAIFGEATKRRSSAISDAVVRLRGLLRQQRAGMHVHRSREGYALLIDEPLEPAD